MLRDTKANKIFLIVLVLIVAATFFSAQGWNRRNRQERTKQSVSITETDSLRVLTSAHDIILEVDNKRKDATVSIGRNESDTLLVSKTGGTLNINVRKKDRLLSFLPYHLSTVVVTLPSSKLDTIDLATLSGDITIVHALEVSSLNAKSTSGDIDILTLDAKESVALKSTSGSIEGRAIRSSGTIDLSSTSGSLEVEQLTGKQISLKTVSGEIESDVTILAGGSLEAASTSGDLEIAIRNTDGLSIKANSVSGDVYFNDSSRGKKAEATTGSGSTRVNLSTGSGNIELDY